MLPFPRQNEFQDSGDSVSYKRLETSLALIKPVKHNIIVLYVCPSTDVGERNFQHLTYVVK